MRRRTRPSRGRRGRRGAGGDHEVLGRGVDARHPRIGGPRHPAAGYRGRRHDDARRPGRRRTEPDVPRDLRGDGRARHRARARRRPGLDLDDRGRRAPAASGCPARRMPQTPATSPSTSRARGSSRPTTRAGASRRIRWHRMSRPTPRTPSCSRAPARIANARRHRIRTRRWWTPPGTGCSCPTSAPTGCACSGSADARGLAHDASADLVIHAGAGPRHLVIAGDLAVVANELDRTASLVDLVRGPRGRLVPGRRPASRPVGSASPRSARRASGTVLVGDRDADALVALRLDADAGTLEHVASVAIGRAASARPAAHARRAVRARRRPGVELDRRGGAAGRRADGGGVDARHAGSGLPGAHSLTPACATRSGAAAPSSVTQL